MLLTLCQAVLYGVTYRGTTTDFYCFLGKKMIALSKSNVTKTGHTSVTNDLEKYEPLHLFSVSKTSLKLWPKQCSSLVLIKNSPPFSFSIISPKAITNTTAED